MGSQRRQAPGDAERRLATITPVNWLFRRRQATSLDCRTARIEHDKALGRVMTAVLKDDTELFKQFSDNESFKKWLSDSIFAVTYEESGKKSA